MANINHTILNGLFQVYAPQQIISLTGTYDGINMELSMVWSDDTITSTFKFPWVIGMSKQNFTDRLMDNYGKLVQQYNERYTTPAFDEFMLEVTE